MYTLERFYIISKFFKSENDRNARPTTHNISQQRQKEFLLKDVMKLHEGHEFMEKILRANDFSRRLRTVLLRAAQPAQLLTFHKSELDLDAEAPTDCEMPSQRHLANRAASIACADAGMPVSWWQAMCHRTSRERRSCCHLGNYRERAIRRAR